MARTALTPQLSRSRSSNNVPSCTLDLPLTLRTALDLALEHVKPSELARATREVSDRYRQTDGQPYYLRTARDVLAYAAFRLPATYAATSAALHEIKGTMPDWRPNSLLDAGAGPGSASWAAVDTWPSIIDFELVETDGRMISLGRALMAADRNLSAARWTQSDLNHWSPDGHCDLVVMSYALGELDEPQRSDLVRRVWEQSSGVLVLIEPGTPAGFEVIRHARADLIALGAQVVAPCPHSSACPMAAGDWCHFSQRLARSRAHRDAKRVSIGYEDEKYSYVAVARVPATPASARVLRHPQIRPGHIRLELCTNDGLQHRIVSKRDTLSFREARHASWGSGLPSHPRREDRTQHAGK